MTTTIGRTTARPTTEPRQTTHGPKGRPSVLGGAGHVVLFLWAIVVVVPLIWVFLASFKNTTEIFSSPWTLPAELRWENWGRAWTKARVGRFFFNSVIVV